MSENFLKSFGSILALGLPITQFFIQYTEKIKSLDNLFINKEMIFFTTLITFLLSIFLLFVTISYKYFRWAPNRSQWKKYQQYLRDTNPQKFTPEEISKVEFVNAPFELTVRNSALFSIIIVFISASTFLAINQYYTLENDTAALIQAISYIVTMTLSVFIIMAFTLEKYDQSKSQQNRRERIKKAINLAVENDSFPSMPKIIFNFINTNYSAFPAQLITEVQVNERTYKIVTDLNAEELIAVNDVTPPTSPVIPNI